ncbi:hypothetical protein HYS94_03005 [Candidatus Daviesbacteria bacterium]|nr:hypothetical protein [Candidatus Daviesbacteria bacterium]
MVEKIADIVARAARNGDQATMEKVVNRSRWDMDLGQEANHPIGRTIEYGGMSIQVEPNQSIYGTKDIIHNGNQ